jgi:hypothetical protein
MKKINFKKQLWSLKKVSVAITITQKSKTSGTYLALNMLRGLNELTYSSLCRVLTGLYWATEGNYCYYLFRTSVQKNSEK